MRRHLLGLIALGLILAGVSMLAVYGWTTSEASMAASICLRSGIVLAALWLAWPQALAIARRLPPVLTIASVLGALVVAARPQLFLFVAGALGVLALLQGVAWLFKPLPKGRPPPAGKPARGAAVEPGGGRGASKR